MRVATWNINGLRARIDFVLHWLRQRQPDVVGLQELKLTDEQFPHDVFEAEGYHAVSYGQKSWNGVAILSRQPAIVTQRGLPGEDAYGSRLITADVGGISFTTIYLPNGKSIEHADYSLKLRWVESLRKHFDAAHNADQAAILCGDFNIVPEPIDSWSEDRHTGLIFHTDDERQRYRAILDWGFHDLFRHQYPSEQQFSWWDYRGGAFHRKQGLRIDFLLGTKSIVERLKSVEIDREFRKKLEGLTASDHAPVIADIE